MDLRQLRYFAVICEEGSLSKAGSRLHIAQQSLSQTVAAMEAELGVQLLQRGSFGVRATAAGRVLHDRGTALLRDADALARAVQLAAGGGSGQVRIRYGLDSEHIVSGVMRKIQARLPGVQITGWTSSDRDNVAALRAGDTDLAFAWAAEGQASDLHTATVAYEQCWAAVPTGHPLAHRDALPIHAVAGQPLVMFPRESASWVFDYIAANLTADGRVPPQIFQTQVSGQAGMVDAAVAAGAVAPISSSLAKSLQRPETVIMPFDPEIAVPLDLIWRAGLPPAAAAVVAAAAALAD